MRETLLALSVAAMAWAASSGCASDCARMRGDFDDAVAAASPFVDQVPADGPLHFGVAVKDHVLDEVVARALNAGLEQALTFADEIALATGQAIRIAASGNVAEIGLFPDKACEACLRVDGRLGGELAIKLPVLGTQKVPLTGTFSLVAPVEFATTSSGEAAVMLDLGKAAKVGKSQVRPEVTQLPPTWWRVIESPLGKLMLEAITKNLEPVTLFRFRGPDLGIEGLEVHPATIVSNAATGVVFAGFRTNLAAAFPAGSSGMTPQTKLGKNEDIAVAVDARVITAAAAALLHSGKLSRTWTPDGKPSPDGEIHVTMREVSIGASDDAGKTPVTLGFRAWNLPKEKKCWWADANATGSVEVRDDKLLSVAVDEVKLGESSMPGVFTTVANWKVSSFILDTSRVITKSLADDALEFPGGKLDVRRAKISAEGSTLWLKGKVAVAPKTAD